MTLFLFLSLWCATALSSTRARFMSAVEPPLKRPTLVVVYACMLARVRVALEHLRVDSCVVRTVCRRCFRRVDGSVIFRPCCKIHIYYQRSPEPSESKRLPKEKVRVHVSTKIQHSIVANTLLNLVPFIIVRVVVVTSP